MASEAQADSSEPDRTAAPLSVVGDAVGWGVALAREISMLPDTLRTFREAMTNFQEATQKLNASTEVASRAGAHAEAVGLVEAMRVLDETATALERQTAAMRDRLPGRQLFVGMANDLRRIVNSLGEAPASDEPPAEAGGSQP